MSNLELVAIPGLERPTPPEPDLPKATERDVLDALRLRYRKSRAGNGYRWAYVEHVRSRTGFADGVRSLRVADAIAFDCWESHGLEIHGHEVKVSRADWLTELRDPTKAEAFRPYVHRWWLVVSDRRIVRDDLPDGWGLMVAAGGSVRIVKRAPRNKPLPMPSAMLASLLRAATGDGGAA